ncbi:MAG TPA: hypothetical protein VMT37_09730 [Solirubrobacterales bacterium]|nr:hypothetical protein [Solirubrobacterales bacterium]
MATIIHFVGKDQVMVREEEAEVQAAFADNNGRPVALTHQRTGKPVFVNLDQVTYWHGRGTREPAAMPWSVVSRAPSSV